MMHKLCVRNCAVPIDGYGARPSQDRDNPPGATGIELHELFYPTPHAPPNGGT